MAAEPETGTVRLPNRIANGAVAGSLAGFAAGVVGGLVLQVVNPGVLADAMPALLGLAGAGLTVGWVVHLVVSAIFGGVYGVAVDRVPTVDRFADATDARSLAGGTVLGLAFGVLLWVAIAVVAVPTVLSAIGYAGAPAFPYLDAMAFGAYVLFGLVVGLGYATLIGR